MKAERVERLINGWAKKMGHYFRQRDLDTLVELISDATEAELEDLRSDLQPVNGNWEDEEC